MLRTIPSALALALLSSAYVSCGTDDSKSTTTPTTSAKQGDPAPAKLADKPAEKSPSAAAEAAQPKPPEKVAETPPPAKPAANDPIANIREFIASKKIDKDAKNWKTKVQKPPQLTFDPAHTYYWVLDTSEGPIKVRLMPDVAPMHVSSTIYLTELGFYDGLPFHRVLRGFMAQGGDPLGTGTGGPAYRMNTEISPKAKHSKAGILSTANTGQPGSDGSQFFLTFRATPQLDGGYTVFGEVVEGLETLKKIESFGAAADPEPPSKRMEIRSAKITTE